MEWLYPFFLERLSVPIMMIILRSHNADYTIHTKINW